MYACSSDDGNSENPSACSSPTGILANSITSNSAVINWSSNTQNATYEIQYGVTGFGLGNGNTLNSGSTNVALNGLTSNTSYQVYVRTNCGENGFSDWVGPSSFSTSEQACNNPTDLQLFNLIDDGVSLAWSSDGSAMSFDIEYGISGFAIGEGTVINSSNTFIEITGLTPSTPYDFYVKANCSNSNSSDYSGPASITTEAACATPFGLDFFDLLACSFSVYWQTNDETSWQIEYGEVGFTLGNGTIINTSNQPYVITENLSPGTTYEVYVRANCGSQGYSAYSDALVVTTNQFDDSFLIGEYLIQDVNATTGPGNGTENFEMGTVTLDIDPSNPNRRVFYVNVLPAFTTEGSEIILEINGSGSITLNDVNPGVSCDATTPFIYTSAGSNNSSIDSCSDNNFIVINYIEDPQGSCGGPFNSSFSLTKQ